MRGTVIAAVAFAAGLALGALLWIGGGANDRASRIVIEQPTPGRDAPTLKESIEAIDLPEPERGDGWIRGEVVDEHGNPIPGVRVSAWREGGTPVRKSTKAPAGPARVDVDSLIADRVRPRLAIERRRVWAATGDDGRYEIAGLADGKYAVEAYREGLQLKCEGVYHGRRPGEFVRFVGRPIVRVPVDVVFPEEYEPTPCQIRIRSGTRTSGESWSALDPWIEVTPGTYEIRAVCLQDPLRAQSEPQTLTVAVGDRVEPVRLVLESGLSLRIRVAVPPRFVWQHVSVELQQMDERGNGVPVSRGGPLLHPERDGFGWSELMAGRYRARARMGAAPPGEWTTFALGNGLTQIDLEAPPPDPARAIVVTVRSPDGRVLTEVEFVSRELSKDESGRDRQCRALARTDGTYVLPMRESGDVPLELCARHAQYGAATARIDRISSAPVDIRFKNPSTAMILVDGAAAAGCSSRLFVSLSRSGSDPVVPGDAGHRLGEDSRAEFTRLQPGRYELQLWLAQSADGDRQSLLARHAFDLGDGVQQIEMTMPELHVVRVKWSGEGPTRVMMHRAGAGRFGAWWTADAKPGEVVEFDYVPAGRFDVAAGDGGRNVVTIRVPENADVTLP